MEVIIKGNIDKVPSELYKIKYRLPLIDSIVIEVSDKNLDIIKEYTEYHSNVVLNTCMNRARELVHCKGAFAGRGVTIAFLDTGICKTSDFDNRILYFKDFVNNKTKLYDDNGHGVHICGIACGSGKSSAGKYRGIAPKANIVMLKTLDSEGSGNGSDVLAGIQWIYDNYKKFNIKIVNMSIGTRESGRSDPLVSAVETLWDSGIVVVTAAGNNGPEPYTIASPGTSRKVITVGSSDDSENKTLKKGYSSRGPTRECIIKPDILAPGSGITSCKCADGQYRSLSGTSMSTPIVSGAIALLLEKYPDLTPDDVKYMIKLSADDLNQPSNKQGWGLLNIDRLLNMEVYYVRK